MNTLRQTATVTILGFRTMPARWKGALTMIAGIGCMVFALLSLLVIMESGRQAIAASGSPDRAVVRAIGDAWLGRGSLPSGLAATIAQVPHVKLATREIHFGIGGLVKRNNGEEGDANLVGVEQEWLQKADHIHLLSGRFPLPGTQEVIVGRYAAQKFMGIGLGQTIRFSQFRPGRPPVGGAWRVVGIYISGDWWDGYIVGDHSAVQKATHQGDSAIRVRLDAAGNFNAFRAALTSRLSPGLTVERETDSYAGLWRAIPKLGYIVAFLLGALASIGALAATTFTVQVVTEARAHEIAVLRVSGFNGSAVAFSLAVEAVVLAVVGGLTATGLIGLWLDGFLYSAAGSVFQIEVGTRILLIALGCATMVALLGALPAMLRTTRQSVMHAIRDL